MPRRTAFSAQTLSVLAALAARPSDWRHGYDLARETGLKSGTLYPILVRLADRELVEACWEEGEPAGHLLPGPIGIAADEPPDTLGELLIAGHAVSLRRSAAGRSRVLTVRQRAAAAGRG